MQICCWLQLLTKEKQGKEDFNVEHIFRKNEAEINENVAKGLLIVFSCILFG